MNKNILTSASLLLLSCSLCLSLSLSILALSASLMAGTEIFKNYKNSNKTLINRSTNSSRSTNEWPWLYCLRLKCTLYILFIKIKRMWLDRLCLWYLFVFLCIKSIVVCSKLILKIRDTMLTFVMKHSDQKWYKLQVYLSFHYDSKSTVRSVIIHTII